tara:strand:+ start:2420 stop:3835 length:1416 start_codon:yes stop_codon:yes gene_type:complete
MKIKQSIVSCWQRTQAWFEKRFSKHIEESNNNDDAELVELNTAPEPPVKKLRQFGVLTLVIFFGGFGMWSLLTTLETAAVAPGVITVDSQRQIIEHLEGGIVNKIYVRDGDVVKQGETLVKLDDTRAKIAYELSHTEVNALSALSARLEAELSNANTVHFPESLMAQMSDPAVEKLVGSQERIFQANLKARVTKGKILEQRKGQLEQQIIGFQAQLTSQDLQLKYIKEETEAVAYLEKKRLIERPRLLALLREQAKLNGNRGDITSNIAKTRQQIGETELEILTFETNNTKEMLTELRETNKLLGDEIEKEKVADDTLRRTNVVAPVSGTVVDSKVATVGGVISQGEVLMHIVPNDDALVIDAKINPLDVDSVHPGLQAKVQLLAFKQRNTPMLIGKVERISADVIQNEQTGEAYYLARIVIPVKQLARLQNKLLHPGMPVQVMIIIDNRTPFSYFVSPIVDSFDKAFREE